MGVGSYPRLPGVVPSALPKSEEGARIGIHAHGRQQNIFNGAAGEDTLTRVGYVHVLVPVPPTAAFTASPTSGAAPLTAQFEDASAPGSSPIEHWHGAFGDGMTSVEPMPNHIYEEPGMYTVTLTVTSGAGSDVMTRTDYIQVDAAPPVGKLLVVALSVCGAKRRMNGE